MRMKIWMKFLKCGPAALACLLVTHLAGAAEAPSWEFEIAESEVVTFETAQWHEKEYGWLLTCRIVTPSTNLLQPVVSLELEGLNAADEVVWKRSKSLRRKDFDTAMGGRDSYFARVLLSDLPPEIVKVVMRLDNGEEQSGTDA
jgi:hypothetical protein